MTKKITSEDCEGNIEDIEDGRYNTHVVPVSAEDDPGYEEIDYGDCTEFTVPLGRYGSHVVPIGGGSGSSMKACADGGLKIVGTGDEACMAIKTETGSALVLDGGVLKIDSTKIKVTSDNVLPAGTDPGLVSTLPVFTDPDGNTWNNQSDYNKWLYEEQKRQDEDLENLDLSEYVTLVEFNQDQQRQDEATRNAVVVLEAEILALAIKTQEDQQRQDDELEADQKRQDDELEADQKRQDEAIDDLEKALYGSSCNPADITTELVFGHYSVGDDVTKIYWTPDYLKLPEGKQWGWFNPGSATYCPDALYINGVEHKVTRGSNVSGTEWKYHLATAPDAALDGEIVTVSQCPDTLPLFVTHPELQADQQRQDEEIEKRVLKAGDTMTGNLIVNADVHANRVDTLNVDSGENSNLLLKHDGNTKVYIGGTQVTIQNPLQLNTEGRDPKHAVTKGYIDALDAKQAAEINTLEYKLDALLGLTFQGTYEFKHDQTCEEEYQECKADCTNDARCEQDCLRDYSTCEQNNVEPGFFEAVDPDGQFDHLQEIIISKNDKSGVEVDWAGVLAKDDYLEVDHVFQGQLDKTNYGLYRIVEEPETHTNSQGEVVYVMQLQFLQGDGVLNEKELYEIRGITAAEGVNPEELADFLLKEDAAKLYATKTHDHDDLTTTVGVHSTVTLSSGNAAKVTNMGDTKNASFKFEIPKGANGTNGTNGTNGSKGADLVMSTGTSTSPSLNKGQMYLNTSQKVLYIGVT